MSSGVSHPVALGPLHAAPSFLQSSVHEFPRLLAFRPLPTFSDRTGLLAALISKQVHLRVQRHSATNRRLAEPGDLGLSVWPMEALGGCPCRKNAPPPEHQQISDCGAELTIMSEANESRAASERLSGETRIMTCGASAVRASDPLNALRNRHSQRASVP